MSPRSRLRQRHRWVPKQPEQLEHRRVLSTLTVTNTLDGPIPPVGSLRFELSQARPGDTVNFADTLSGQTIVLEAGGFYVRQGVNVTCTTSKPVTINGLGGIVFDFLSGTSSLSGVNIVHAGTNFGGVTGPTEAGFINNYGSTLIVGNVAFSSSAVENGGTMTMFGGAVTNGLPNGFHNNGTFNDSRNTTFRANAEDAFVNVGTAYIINASFTGNAGDAIVNQSPLSMGLTLSHCTVSQNVSTDGRPIVALEDAATIQLTTIANNSGSYAVQVSNFSSTTTLFGVFFSGNHDGALEGTETGALSIASSTFRGNSGANNAFVSAGGVIELESGVNTISNSTITSNSTKQVGAVDYSPYLSGSLLIRGSTIDHNAETANPFSPSGGAGISSFMDVPCTLTVDESTIAYNIATGNGGGFLGAGYSGSVWNFTNDTIAYNEALTDSYGRGSGGGVAQFVASSGTLTLRNTIVAANGASVSNPDVTGPGIRSNGYNLIGNAGSVTGWKNTDIVGNSARPVNPELGPLQTNGTGTTRTFVPLRGSLAIGHGDPASAGKTDQNGVTRAVPDTIGSVYVAVTTRTPVLPATTPDAVDLVLVDLDILSIAAAKKRMLSR